MDGLPVEERSTEGREAGVTVARRFVEGVADEGVLESTGSSGFRFLPVVRANDDLTLRPAAVTAPTKVGETGVTPSEISRINSAMTPNPTRRGGADDITAEGGKSTGGGSSKRDEQWATYHNNKRATSSANTT